MAGREGQLRRVEVVRVVRVPLVPGIVGDGGPLHVPVDAGLEDRGGARVAVDADPLCVGRGGCQLWGLVFCVIMSCQSKEDGWIRTVSGQERSQVK